MEPHACSGLTEDWAPGAYWLSTGSPTQVLCGKAAEHQPSPGQTVPWAMQGREAGLLSRSHGLCSLQAVCFPLRSHLWGTHSHLNGADILVKYLNFICWSSREDAIRFYSKRCFQELVCAASGDPVLSLPRGSILWEPLTPLRLG